MVFLGLFFLMNISAASLSAMNYSRKDVSEILDKRKEYCQVLQQLEPFMFSAHRFPLVVWYEYKCQEYSKIIKEMKNSKPEAE